MNKIRHFLLAVVAALFATTGHAATILLQPSSSNVSVGDELLIDVILQDAFAGEFADDVLLAFGFNLSFDSNALSLISSTIGAGWDDDSPWLDVDVAGSAFPGIEDDGSSVDILLARLSFNTLNAGNFALAISGNPLDNPNLGLIYLGGEAALLAQTLIAVQPVPLPAAGWLLATGLIALFRVRRCR
jgi:hypothetical protein